MVFTWRKAPEHEREWGRADQVAAPEAPAAPATVSGERALLDATGPVGLGRWRARLDPQARRPAMRRNGPTSSGVTAERTIHHAHRTWSRGQHENRAQLRHGRSRGHLYTQARSRGLARLGACLARPAHGCDDAARLLVFRGPAPLSGRRFRGALHPWNDTL